MKHLQTAIIDGTKEIEPLMGDASALMNMVVRAEQMGTWRVDLKSMLVWWSPRVYEIHGLPVGTEAIELETTLHLYHGEDAKTVAALMVKAISEKSGFSYVQRLDHADGSVRLVEATAGLELNDRGEPVSVVGYLKDVTSKYAMADLSESRGQLVRSLVANAPSPIAVLNRKFCYLDVSPAWIQYYGLSAREGLIGQSLYKAMPDISKTSRDEHQRVLSGEVISREYSLQPDGVTVNPNMGSTLFPWRTVDGKIGGLIIMLAAPSDVGEQVGSLRQIAELMGEKQESCRSGLI